MELKVGDKVRFLNEKGGGIVSALVSTSMVKVAIEEGFEVPVLVKDLIKIDPGGAADRFFDRPVNVTLSKSETKSSEQRDYFEPVKRNKVEDGTDSPTDTTDESDPVSPLYRQSGAGITEGIYLLWEPQDQKWLITGNVDIILVNNTKFDAIFSFILEEENNIFAGVNYDVIPPYSSFHIETITREDLEAWSTGVVQVLFHSQESQELIRPLHAQFKVKPTRFFKENGYQDFKLTGAKAIILNIGDLASQKFTSGNPLDKVDVDPGAKQKIDAITPSALIDKHRIGPREAEVDLHISALRTDYASMPQNEILKYQIDYFDRMLESAISFNYFKVIFIHGIGNGILKSAIISKLKDYENVELRKARFEQYGNGAVEIIIHN